MDLEEEALGSEGPSLSHHIKSAYCQQDLSLLMLTLVTWPRFRHCDITCPPPPPSSTLRSWEGSRPARAQPCPTLWRSCGLPSARLLSPWDFPRQECWSGLPFPPPGDLPDPGTEPRFQRLLHWQVDSLTSEPPGKKGKKEVTLLASTQGAGSHSRLYKRFRLLPTSACSRLHIGLFSHISVDSCLFLSFIL